MAGNHFDTPVIIDDGIGSSAAPGAYIGLGVDVANLAVSLGPRIYGGTGDPNVPLVVAPAGSFWSRTDTVPAELWFCTVASTTWVQIAIP
jgi:hypothetical protein